MLDEKDKYELRACGGYERIYPILEKDLANDERSLRLDD
jgi:hypothetical protein